MVADTCWISCSAFLNTLVSITPSPKARCISLRMVFIVSVIRDVTPEPPTLANSALVLDAMLPTVLTTWDSSCLKLPLISVKLLISFCADLETLKSMSTLTGLIEAALFIWFWIALIWLAKSETLAFNSMFTLSDLALLTCCCIWVNDLLISLILLDKSIPTLTLYLSSNALSSDWIPLVSKSTFSLIGLALRKASKLPAIYTPYLLN